MSFKSFILIFTNMKAISIAVLASGRGSNFQAIINGIREGEINGNIKVLISDNPNANALKIAEKNSIKTNVLNPISFKNREEVDLKIKQILDDNLIDLVVLAGYMKIIKSKKLLDKYQNKIINIHPSLLPAFKGSTNAQKDAFDYGCKISGLTIHFVSSEVDGGKIIFQKAVDISNCNSPEEVSAKIIKYEHSSYRKVISMFSKGVFEIKNNKVIYKEK